MKLILTRHAKSDWDDPLLSDHDRPLNARGQRNAPVIGKWLQTRGYLPETCLVSAAKRAQETADLITGTWPSAPNRQNFEGLYHASPFQILGHLQDHAGGDTMLVGHNPGIADCAEMLVSAPPNHPQFFRYPTCATLVLEFPTRNWSGIAEGSGQVLDFIVPRDLDE